MNHKLAKQLKDAGFEQKGITWYWKWFTLPEKKWELVGSLIGEKDIKGISESVAAPTLSELIKACGDEFMKVEHYPSEDEKWRAYSYSNTKSNHNRSVAKTPEEAVAKLWLELNRK